MNYKKMLAATAVTSAAIIVPSLVVEASDVGISDTSIKVKPGIDHTEAVKFNTKITADIDSIVDLPANTPIEGYEWYIVDGNNANIKIPNANTMDLIVPAEAAGKKIELVVRTKASSPLVVEGGSTTGEQITDNNYISRIDVSNFKLGIANSIELIGTNGSAVDVPHTAATGDTVTIGQIVLEDASEQQNYPTLELPASQVVYSYQWYQKSSDKSTAYSKIENSTSRNFTIPANADTSSLSHYFVEITAHVNGQKATTMSQTINVGGTLILTSDLNNRIKGIISNDQDQDSEPAYLYMYESENLTELETIKTRINNLITEYNKLTPNSKKLITNYPMLTEALANVILVEQLVADISKVNVENFSNKEITNIQLKQFTKDFQPLFARYEQLDSLQRSLLGDTTELFEAYTTLLKMTDPQAEISGIFKINTAITNLFYTVDSLREAYNIDGYDNVPTYKTPVLYIDAQVKEINTALKIIDASFKPLVYTNLLKQVQTDVTKVQSFIKKVEKIETSAAEKKVSAATAALKDYKKLTTLQRSLVNEAYAKIQEALTPTTDEESDDNSLILRIAELVDEEAYTFQGSSVTVYLAEIDSMLAEYKGYTSAKKKLITNYSLLTQAQKDAKAALKVEKLMLELETLNSSIDSSANDKDKLKAMSKAISKYKSTLTAYSKLTPLQQSLLLETFVSILGNYGLLVTDYNELNVSMKPVKEPDPTKEPVPEKEDTFNYEGVKSLIDDINALLQQDKLEYTTADLLTFKEDITQLLADYKTLDSKEKKAVYNYSVLSKVSSDIKKAESTASTIQKAIATKSYDKVLSAQASFNKLSSLQQSLVRVAADGLLVEDMNDLLEEAVDNVTGDGGVTTLIKNWLTEPLSHDEYKIANINELNERYSKLTSKLKKQITNYDLLKEATKDAKAVQSFVTKLLKVTADSPLKNKESIVTSYYKLTAAQTNLFKNSFVDTASGNYVELLTKFEQDTLVKSTVASELNDKIIGVLVAGEAYSAVLEGTFTAYITSLQAEYKSLSAADKKLVTNYSVLTKAQSNITTVQKVVEQYYALSEEDLDIETVMSSNYKAFEKAYNKLNKLQLSLYSILDTEHLDYLNSL